MTDLNYGESLFIVKLYEVNGLKKKCAICGYKFKDKDEVICPECFTARDNDISYNRYTDDLHSHRYGYDEKKSEINNSDNDIFEEFENKEGSFIEEQREDEAENPIPSSTYNKSSYSSSSRQQKLDALKNNYTAQGANNNFRNSYNNGKSTVRWTTTFNPYGSSRNYTRVNFKKNKSSRTGGLISVVFFIFFAVIIFSAIADTRESNDDAYNYNYDHDYDFDIDYSMPDFSFPVPDISEQFEHSYTDSEYGFKITADNLTTTGHYEKLSDYDATQYIILSDDTLADEGWSLVSADIELIPDFSDVSRYIESAYISCTSIIGDDLCTSYVIEYNDEGDGYENITFLIPDDTWMCDIVLNTSNDYGEEQEAYIEVEKYYFNTDYSSNENLEL